MCIYTHAAAAQLLSYVWLFVTLWTVVHQAPLSMGILQARILEWVAIPFYRGSSQPRDLIQVSWIAGRFFTVWATGEGLLLLWGFHQTQLIPTSLQKLACKTQAVPRALISGRTADTQQGGRRGRAAGSPVPGAMLTWWGWWPKASEPWPRSCYRHTSHTGRWGRPLDTRDWGIFQESRLRSQVGWSWGMHSQWDSGREAVSPVNWGYLPSPDLKPSISWVCHSLIMHSGAFQ